MIFQFGNITNPFKSINPTSPLAAATDQGQGLLILSNSLLKFAILMAGVYAFWNFIAAGYGFMSAGEDAKAVGKAWSKFTQSLLGLTFVAGSFVLAAIFGLLIFGDARAIISPTIFGPIAPTP